MTNPQIPAPKMVRPPVRTPITTKKMNGSTRARVASTRPTGPKVVVVLRQRVLMTCGGSVAEPAHAGSAP